jgi:hypothetical protein
MKSEEDGTLTLELKPLSSYAAVELQIATEVDSKAYPVVLTRTR